MGYKLHDQCYETLFDFHVAFAQECSKIGGQGTSAIFYTCVATPDYVTIQGYSAVNGSAYTPFNHNPQQISCTYQAPKSFTNADVVDLSWLVVGVWVVAWGIRKLIDTFKTS